MIALLPRPVDAGGLVCIVAGTDVQGVRRASKLLSPRTGVPVSHLLLPYAPVKTDFFRRRYLIGSSSARPLNTAVLVESSVLGE